MTPTLAASALRVPHSRIRELAEIAMSMDGVLKLYFGESNLPTPEYIKRAAQKAMADGFTFYTENAGLPSLRKALARYYQELHGLELDPAGEFVITASGVQALNVGIRCVLDPGDEALVLTPAWPNGASIVAMANAVTIEIAHPLVGDRYQIDFAALEPARAPRNSTSSSFRTRPGWLNAPPKQHSCGVKIPFAKCWSDSSRTGISASRHFPRCPALLCRSRTALFICFQKSLAFPIHSTSANGC